MLELNRIHLGDCLDLMADIPDGSVDMILCDIPYGTTACKWDAVIPFAPLWAHWQRIAKPSAAIVLTASQPFTSALVMSNARLFKYALVWDKVNRYNGALNANKMPMKRHEDVLVFYKKQPTYNKQMRPGAPYVSHKTSGHGAVTQYGEVAEARTTVNAGGRNPCSILPFAGDVKTEMGLHPTQKPLSLFEYLINTFTDGGEIVLDNCIGSGTTAVACLNTGRQFIGIEKDPVIHAGAVARLVAHANEPVF